MLFLSLFFFFPAFASSAQCCADPNFFWGGRVELQCKIVHYSEILDLDVHPQESCLVLQKLGVVVFRNQVAISLGINLACNSFLLGN